MAVVTFLQTAQRYPMARPKHDHPTPAELEVLKLLWDRGALTVRDVLDEFTRMRRRRAYTSVMSLMNVMAEKRLLRRRRQGRAFVYEPRIARDATLADMVGDLCERAFESSAPLLVSRLLEQANPTSAELDEIRRLIDEYRGRVEGGELRVENESRVESRRLIAES